jgi:transposase
MCAQDVCREAARDRYSACPKDPPRRRARAAFRPCRRRPVSERLLAHLAMPTSDNTILRRLKRHVGASGAAPPVRVAAIDDWSWRKGFTYGTIIVDLERRNVVDVLPVRSVEETARWLKRHPEIEIVSRDRCGLYAQGTRQGAPRARQVADRFHLLQNLRESIERQMSDVSRFAGRSLLPPVQGDQRHPTRQAQRDARQNMFSRAQDLHTVGKPVGDIADEIGVGRRTVTKWIQSGCLQARRPTPPKPSSPSYFQDFLSRQWEAGYRRARHLFQDIRHRGYTGSYSHLERLLSLWRRADRGESSKSKLPADETQAVDPATGWQISPIVAASLCMRPKGMLTPSQAVKVATLKKASPSFVVMRRLSMRFRGILRGDDPAKLGRWLDDARRSEISSMQRFAQTLARDLDAVKNAVTEEWSSGQAEGQINRLKTLKRAMYGRASVELLRARMLPLEMSCEHGE